MSTMKADLHVHSSASFDVPDLPAFSPLALFRRATEHSDPARRMDFFALTDHDTMAGYEQLIVQLLPEERARVIPAVEHTLQDPSIGFTIHVNLFGLTPEQYRKIRRARFGLDALLAYCDANGILAQYNHPAWWERRELKAGVVDFDRVRQVASRFRVIEVSAARTRQQNRIAVGLAAELGLSLTCSTDTHTGDVGRACTEAHGDTVADFLDAIRRGDTLIHFDSLSRSGLVRESRGLIEEYIERGPDVRRRRESGRPILARLEELATRVVGSSWARNSRLFRRSLRTLMNGITRLFACLVLKHENGLERRLADSELSEFMQPKPPRGRLGRLRSRSRRAA